MIKRLTILLVLGFALWGGAVWAQSVGSTPIEYGDTVRDTISDTTPSIYYSFSGSEGDVVTITMVADNTFSLDTYLSLYTSSAGQPAVVVATNDDAGDSSLGVFDSQIKEVSLPDDGIYLIEATRFSGAGDFTLTLELVSGAEFSPGIRYGESVRGYVDGSAREIRYAFEGGLGDVVTITMIADDMGELDTYLYLYDTSFSELARNDDAADSSLGRYNSQIVDFALPSDGVYYIGASRFSGGGEFTLTLEAEGFSAASGAMVELRQWADSASGSSQFGTDGWSFNQATGEPDTFTCGDIRTAWASSSRTGQDFLILDYVEAVIPTQINIYQTYNPGAIISVEVENIATAQNVSLPDSADPVDNTPCPGVFTLDVTGVDFAVDRVIIYLDQTLTGSWNEIDAVELVGLGAGNAMAEEGLLFDVPEGWVVTEEAPMEYFIASSQALLDAFFGSDDLELGVDDQIILLLPYEPLDPSARLTDVLEEMKDVFGDETTVFGMTIVDVVNGIPGAFASVRDEGDSGYLAAVQVDDTIFAMLSLVGDTMRGADRVTELMGTMRFAGAESGTAGGTLSVGNLTVSLPDGWFGEVQFENVFMASDQATLDVLLDGGFDTIASGQIGVSFIPLNTGIFPELGVSVTTVEGVLELFNEAIGSSGNVVTYDSAPFRAALSFAEGEFVPDGAVLIATVSSEGFLMWAVQVGIGDDFFDYEDIVFEIIESVRAD